MANGEKGYCSNPEHQSSVGGHLLKHEKRLDCVGWREQPAPKPMRRRRSRSWKKKKAGKMYNTECGHAIECPIYLALEMSESVNRALAQVKSSESTKGAE